MSGFNAALSLSHNADSVVSLHTPSLTITESSDTLPVTVGVTIPLMRVNGDFIVQLRIEDGTTSR